MQPQPVTSPDRCRVKAMNTERRSAEGNTNMTNKEKNMLWNYEHAQARDIHEAYGRPSARKVNAFTHCREAAYMMNGYDCRIPSASRHFFTFAFRYRDTEGTERMYYDTGRNVYDFALA